MSQSNQKIAVGKYDFRLSISIGFAMYPRDGNNADECIKSAAVAMYDSKEVGKNRFNFVDQRAKERSLENVMYTNQLFNALENGEFSLALQPQIGTETCSMSGAEVLLRWHSPVFGTVPPIKFIPILEHTGLINEVGKWVIDEAIRLQERLFQAGYPKFRISVNLSPVQFRDSDVVEIIRSALARSVIEAKYFELEITKGMTINQPVLLNEILNKIRQIGCSIAIDDFGVEFSSLNRLKSLPIDRLKIDKSFTDGIGQDQKIEAIITTMLDLTKALNIKAISEGVETVDQIAFLQSQGCTEMQGYFYARPLNYEDFKNFLKNQHEILNRLKKKFISDVKTCS